MSRSFLRPARLLPLLIFLSLLLLFFHRLSFSGQILARGDTFLYFYPYWEAAAEALRAGRVPLWNPHLFMGAPFIANSQAGFFYPFNWPLWLLLTPPYAVSASIVLHLFIAGVGTYAAGRRVVGLSRPAALLAALLFALGGYLTAQVEHVNQLQGLAWLPWLLLVVEPHRVALRLKRKDYRQNGEPREEAGAADGKRFSGKWCFFERVLLLSGLFALQLTAGHTQTVFISAVGMVVWSGVRWLNEDAGERLKSLLLRGGTVVAGGGLALLLAAVQLLPTLELMGLSGREGGLPLNEALSFSLHPLLLGHSLLPAYGQSLFSEYVAFLPLTALGLAVVGAWQWRREPWFLAALVLAAVGLFLALGRFNPFYVGLANLPGFSFFRAPARWLVLYSLGMAFLAGGGLDRVTTMLASEQRRKEKRPFQVGVALVLLLIAWRVAAVLPARFVPVGPEAPVEWPALLTGVGWLLEGLLALVLVGWARHQGSPARFSFARGPEWLLISLIVLVLFGASRSLPYNQVTTPEAYFEWRAPIARLRAVQNCGLLPELCQSPPGRLLSLSDMFFDPGDAGEIATIYQEQLSPEALYAYTIATKHKEVLSPNLPLSFDLSSVDGFDGGLLPLRAYTALTSLLLPAGTEATDGRLREYLDAVPEPQWLDLFNARYLITDKVGDVWKEGVFFDTQHPAVVGPGEVQQVGYLPDYEATAVLVLGEGEPGQVVVLYDDRAWWTLEVEPVAEGLWKATLPEAKAPRALYLQQEEGRGVWQVQGVALVDERDETFHTLVPGEYRLIYSGDVKIYENLDVYPRAFLVDNWTWQPDLEASVRAVGAPDFEPRLEAVLEGSGLPVAQTPAFGTADIVQYEAERVVVQTQHERDSLLVLTDSWYPGWQVTVDGNPVELYRADSLFRAVPVPAGSHRVVFSFVSMPYRIGGGITLVTLLLLLLVGSWRITATYRLAAGGRLAEAERRNTSRSQGNPADST